MRSWLKENRRCRRLADVMAMRLANARPCAAKRMGWSRKKGAERSTKVRAREDEREEGRKKVEFGYTRKDVILIGAGMAMGGVGLYKGLQVFAGMDPLVAGNYVQIIFVLVIMLGWASTYVSRVLNKDMTYVKQLKEYEEEVMRKRLEEMTDEEKEALIAEVEAEKEARKNRKR